jgi:hypothetical protein
MTIRNDATRQQLHPRDPRMARAVVPRQGQALLDADLDQQARHTLSRIEAETEDTFGSPGRFVVPAGSTAFAITADPTPSAMGIGPGRGYLGGWLLEAAAPGYTLGTQPHPRTDAAVAAPVAVVVKALIRHVDPVEEPAYADHALGDAQAAGRALVDWQVFPFAPAGAWADPGCRTITGQADYTRMIAPSTGTMAVVPDTAPPATDPCTLSPAGGYSRSENLCYRIEVDGGSPRGDFPTADGPRFELNGLRVKLSRRNASVMARITSVSGTDVTVEPPLLDMLNWFAPGTYAELVSVHDDVDPRDAAATTRLFQVNRATDSVVTLESAAAAAVAGKTDWFLRLWDAFPDGAGYFVVATAAATPDVSQDIDLGDGIKIRLGAGSGGAAAATFRRGDYWTFAARADGTLDWPTPSGFETPHGPETRYAPLAVLTGAPPVAADCRIPAATLTDRVLLFRGGDGQQVMVPTCGGFATLAAPLRVSVVRGRTPVNEARVRWTAPAALSSPASEIDGNPVSNVAFVESVTGADGLVTVEWAIDSSAPLATHKVTCTLLDGNGNPEGTPIVFNAQFATAAGTSYQPGACAVLAGSTTVQQALDELCANLGGAEEPETLSITSIYLLGENGPLPLVEEGLILNGLDVPHTAFVRGIGIGISGNPLACTPEPFDPIVEVELDLPYPTTDYDRLYWSRASLQCDGIGGFFGTQRVRLDGAVEVLQEPNALLDPGLNWQPGKRTQRFLETARCHRFGYAPAVLTDDLAEVGWEFEDQPRILCRLRVRSAHVWAKGDTTERAYLNAEHLGISAGFTHRELLLRERDPQRAADLDMFFYLVVPGG